MIISELTTPAGALRLAASGGRLCLCDWNNHDNSRDFVLHRIKRYISDSNADNQAVIGLAKQQLAEYFSGQRRCFTVPLITFGTPFQRSVWEALQVIEYGHTATYSQIAATIGQPSAVRAVATACRANALSIFIPCHRIIGKNGCPTGYAGGIPTKCTLLSLEQSSTSYS